MSRYFKNFPQVEYKFGNEVTANIIQDLTVYVDIIDQLKDDTTSYGTYDILDGDRPDQVSFKLYGSTNYHWTFYYLNDKLRRQGWPLSYRELTANIKKLYPNRTLVIKEHLLTKFQVGETITGSTSAATGLVVRRNLDLGQIVVKPTNDKTFQAEVITNIIDGVTNSSTVASTSLEYLSAHHYEDTSGNTVDIDPTQAIGAELVEKTYLDRYVLENDEVRRIKVFSPELITLVTQKFEDEL